MERPVINIGSSRTGTTSVRQDGKAPQAEVASQRLLDHLIGSNAVARGRTPKRVEEPFLDLDREFAPCHPGIVRLLRRLDRRAHVARKRAIHPQQRPGTAAICESQTGWGFVERARQGAP